MDDWSDWEAQQRAEKERQRQQDERERHAIAQLLRARGWDKAAALVAISEYSSDQVDNWNGGQYESVFSVPPGQFDIVDDDIRAALTDAARDVVGDAQFAGVSVRVKLVDAAPGWDEDMLREIFERRQSANPGRDVRALP